MTVTWPAQAGTNTSGVGGWSPRDACGRTLLECRRQLSITTFASCNKQKISPSMRDQDIDLAQLGHPSLLGCVSSFAW